MLLKPPIRNYIKLWYSETYSSLNLMNRPRDVVSLPCRACRILVTARNPGFSPGRPSSWMASLPRSQSTTTISPVSVVHRITSRNPDSEYFSGVLILEKMSSEKSAACLRREYGIAERIAQSNGRDDSWIKETVLRLYNSMTWSYASECVAKLGINLDKDDILRARAAKVCFEDVFYDGRRDKCLDEFWETVIVSGLSVCILDVLHRQFASCINIQLLDII